MRDMTVFSIACCETISCFGDETRELGCVICGVDLICCTECDTLGAGENFIRFKRIDVTHISTNVACILTVCNSVNLLLERVIQTRTQECPRTEGSIAKMAARPLCLKNMLLKDCRYS